MKTIILARKPLIGTVAKNVLTHGCGGINIDEARVGAGSIKQATAGNRTVKWGIQEGGCSYEKGTGATFSTEGRWPANLILQHLEECECVGTKKVKGHKGYPNGPGGIWKKGYQQNNQDAVGYTQCSTAADNEPWKGHADADGKETVPNWVCEPGCPARALDEQSGVLTSGKPVGIKKAGTGYHGNFPGGEMTGFGDTGGASRFFKQVKK